MKEAFTNIAQQASYTKETKMQSTNGLCYFNIWSKAALLLLLFKKIWKDLTRKQSTKKKQEKTEVWKLVSAPLSLYHATPSELHLSQLQPRLQGSLLWELQPNVLWCHLTVPHPCPSCVLLCSAHGVLWTSRHGHSRTLLGTRLWNSELRAVQCPMGKLTNEM